MAIPVEKLVRTVGEVFGTQSIQKKLVSASGTTYDAEVVEQLDAVVVADAIDATNDKGEAWRYPVSAGGLLFNVKINGAKREVKGFSRVILGDVTLGLMPNGRGVWVKAESMHATKKQEG